MEECGHCIGDAGRDQYLGDQLVNIQSHAPALDGSSLADGSGEALLVDGYIRFASMANEIEFVFQTSGLACVVFIVTAVLVDKRRSGQ